MSGKSLVVGASGQLGHQVAGALGLGRSVSASRGRAVSVDLSTLTVSEAEHLLKANAIGGAVFCVGGMTDVEGCESQPDLAMRTNCSGPAALAKASAAAKLPFVFVSTEYVFDGANGPYREDSPTNALSVYGKTKLRGEIAVAEAHPEALIVRTTVVYGPDPNGKNFLYQLRRALMEGRLFRAADDQLSTPTYNRDLALAMVALVERGKSGIYHICGPERLSRLDFARQAASAMGLDGGLIVGTPTSSLMQKAPRPLNAGLLTEKLRATYPGMRLRPLRESIRDWTLRQAA